MTRFEIARALDLPEPLPEDEPVLWMGSPRPMAVARRIFRLHWLLGYFAALLVAHGAWQLGQGVPAGKALVVTAGLLLPCALAAGAFLLLAWLTARYTVYALTPRRVLMRIGIALAITVNIPLRRIVSADMRAWPDASGDIALSLAEGEHLAYLHLWPHARPWRLRHPVPMLRCVPEAQGLARALRQACEALAGGPLGRESASAVPRRASEPAHPSAQVAA